MSTEKEPMTPDQFASAMRELQRDYDYDVEVLHGKMDKLMADVLTSLGYQKGIKIYRNQEKWYS